MLTRLRAARAAAVAGLVGVWARGVSKDDDDDDREIARCSTFGSWEMRGVQQLKGAAGSEPVEGCKEFTHCKAKLLHHRPLYRHHPLTIVDVSTQRRSTRTFQKNQGTHQGSNMGIDV